MLNFQHFWLFYMRDCCSRVPTFTKDHFPGLFQVIFSDSFIQDYKRPLPLTFHPASVWQMLPENPGTIVQTQQHPAQHNKQLLYSCPVCIALHVCTCFVLFVGNFLTVCVTLTECCCSHVLHDTRTYSMYCTALYADGLKDLPLATL